mgnify:CR=1 FL=1
MDIGVFIPIANDGWIMPTTSPQHMPSFDLNKAITQKAEGYALDFALSMIKLHGFGGQTEFWDYPPVTMRLAAARAEQPRPFREPCRARRASQADPRVVVTTSKA